jgi:integrase
MAPGADEEDHDTLVSQPEETLDIVTRLDFPEKVLVVLIAATAIRISEALALQWRHIQFDDECMPIEQAFRLAEITTTKTKSSKADVPMCGPLADYFHYWKSQTPCRRNIDYVFASDKLTGTKPRCG